MAKVPASRDWLRSHIGRGSAETRSDQEMGLPQPPLTRPAPAGAPTIDLPAPTSVELRRPDLRECISARESHRKFAQRPITLAELSFLLWATQGVKSVAKDGYFTKRTVPSGGARHPFETWLGVLAVEGLTPGIYRYLPLTHQLFCSHTVENLPAALIEATCGQVFAGRAAVMFAWAAVPYRSEWRYHEHAAKAVLLDAGHVGQNLYLACEALGLGTCAIAAYLQDKADQLFRLDGQDEFIIYCSPVGHPEFSDSANRIS